MRRLLVAVALLGCSSAQTPEDPCVMRPDRRYVCGPPVVTLGTTESKGFVVEGSIDGKPAHLLIDTGAERTVLSAKILGAKDQSGVISTFCAGDMCFRESVWAWDTMFSSDDPESDNGFIGMSTLADLVVGVIPGDPTRIELKSRGDACTGTANELRFTDPGTPLATGSIGGSIVDPLPIDSGSFEATIGSAHADAVAADMVDVVESDLCDVNGCAMKVNAATYTGEYCLFGECSSSTPVKYPTGDIIGASFLKQFRLDFDFPNRRLVYCDAE